MFCALQMLTSLTSSGAVLALVVLQGGRRVLPDPRPLGWRSARTQRGRHFWAARGCSNDVVQFRTVETMLNLNALD